MVFLDDEDELQKEDRSQDRDKSSEGDEESRNSNSEPSSDPADPLEFLDELDTSPSPKEESEKIVSPDLRESLQSIRKGDFSYIFSNDDSLYPLECRNFPKIENILGLEGICRILMERAE